MWGIDSLITDTTSKFWHDEELCIRFGITQIICGILNMTDSNSDDSICHLVYKHPFIHTPLIFVSAHSIDANYFSVANPTPTDTYFNYKGLNTTNQIFYLAFGQYR